MCGQVESLSEGSIYLKKKTINTIFAQFKFYGMSTSLSSHGCTFTAKVSHVVLALRCKLSGDGSKSKFIIMTASYSTTFVIRIYALYLTIYVTHYTYISGSIQNPLNCISIKN